MTDAHFHRNVYETFLSVNGHEFGFRGLHPWQLADFPDESVASRLPEIRTRVETVRAAVLADPHAGVGEIGMDRLRTKSVPEAQRAAFSLLLGVAAELGRPVVLHGAKCWGEVMKLCRLHAGRIPAFLFHGFSRSEGLLPDIYAVNGFVSVGPAALNDHAVNYREMVKRLDPARLLVETDADVSAPAASDAPAAPSARDVLLKVAEIRGMPADELEVAVDANAARFTESLA